MKKYLLLATALAALVSCTSDDFVGDSPSPNGSSQEYGAISFTSSNKAVTRAYSNERSAELLNNNFVLFGTKTATTAGTVFNNYQANYVSNTANSTESNSSNWEYVNYYNVPGGVTTNVGVPAFATSDDNAGKVSQTIKYWDYSTSQYDFAAYSLGTGSNSSYATASAISFTNLGTNNQVFTLTGTADELAACYISDLVTAYNKQAVVDNTNPDNPVETSPAANDYGQPVQFSFRSLAAKIRIAFYETVPGYSVKDVKFYTSTDDTQADDKPTLFTSTAVLPSGSGTMTITYPTTGWANRNATDYNKAHVSFAQASDVAAASTLPFGVLTNYPTSYEGVLASGSFIGRTSNTATYADGVENNTPNAQGKYYTILPYETGANLQLRIKYTLVAIDGYGETINVDNATAVVPAELAKWSPNYAYTYIFKIGDMTNGSTGVDGNNHVVSGLTPITLDAVVVESETGVQETITTVSDPSITTYSKGKVVTENDEYVSGNTIYVIVNSGTRNETLTVGTNAKLYTVTVDDDAAQTISEESVDNALANGTEGTDANDNATWTVTDALGKNLVVTAASGLTAISQIEATDSPTGNAISVVGAKFTAGDAGTIYAFQYLKSAPVYYTAAEVAPYNAELPGALSNNETVYSFSSFGSDTGTPQHGTGTVKVVSTDSGWTTVEVVANNAIDVTAPSFVGQQFKVNATSLTENTYYQLYTTGGVATDIYVTVATSTPDDYNATLPGAVSTSTVKTPGEYGYKIIKIKQ